MRANPAAPINLVEKPVHDHEQDHDCEEPGGGLQVERGDVVDERVHDADGNHPGDQGRDEGEPRAPGNRAAAGAAGARHARGDRGDDENAFEAFAENEHRDVECGNGRAGIGGGRIGRATDGDSLPDHHRDDSERGEKNEQLHHDTETRGGKLGSGRGDVRRARGGRDHWVECYHSTREALPRGCHFLTVNCALPGLVPAAAPCELRTRA